jgi:hypothetical protein
MWYMRMGNHGGMNSTGEDSWFAHKGSVLILPAVLSGRKAGETGKEMKHLAL